MMTSTNVNSSLFRHEMEMLKEFIFSFDAEMRSRTSGQSLFPAMGTIIL